MIIMSLSNYTEHNEPIHSMFAQMVEQQTSTGKVTGLSFQLDRTIRTVTMALFHHTCKLGCLYYYLSIMVIHYVHENHFCQ